MYGLWGDDKAYGLRIRQELADLEKVLQDDLEEAGATGVKNQPEETLNQSGFP